MNPGNTLNYPLSTLYKGDLHQDVTIEKENGILLNGRKVRNPPKKERERELRGRARSLTNVYIKNLEPDLSDEQLRKVFSIFGDIMNYRIVRNEYGNSKCYGYVLFKHSEHAAKAVEEMNGKQIVYGGKLLYVAFAFKKSHGLRKLNDRLEERLARLNGYNLFVHNLDENIDDECLRREFSYFGNIISARVVRKEGRSKGYGFICYSRLEEAVIALEEMNRRIVLTKPVYVTIAQSNK